MSQSEMTRPWEEIENDCLSMIMYFYRNSGPASWQTFEECCDETGIPVQTIKWYVHHYKVEKNRWFLGVVANKYGYIARYCNDSRIKVYVEKKTWSVDHERPIIYR